MMSGVSMGKVKRIVIFVLAFILIFMSIDTVSVYAEEYVPYDMRTNVDIKSMEEREAAKANAFNMEVQSNTWENWPEGPGTYGEAAIVMEAGSGAILYAKNIDGLAYPASITKVLTTLIALENREMDDVITITQECLECLGDGYAHIGLKAGEELKLEDLLYAVLLASANEAAHALAENWGDGYDAFIEEMNTRVRELGGTESNFVNTNGVHDEKHFTTAKEMALITRELLLNHPEFEQICQTLQYTIGETNLTNETRTFQQKHKMLLEYSDYYDPRVIAGKTGYTDYALNTLITCAEDENLELVVVNLKTYEGALYQDTENLLNYGFDNFEKISVSKDDITSEIESIKAGSYLVVPKGVTISDLEQKLIEGDGTNSKVEYTYNGQSVGSIAVTLKEQVAVQKEETEVKETEELLSLVKKIVLVCIIIALLFVVYMVFVIIVRYKRKKERQRRRAMKRRRMMEMERERRRQLAIQEERERRRQEYYRRNRRR